MTQGILNSIYIYGRICKFNIEEACFFQYLTLDHFFIDSHIAFAQAISTR